MGDFFLRTRLVFWSLVKSFPMNVVLAIHLNVHHQIVAQFSIGTMNSMETLSIPQNGIFCLEMDAGKMSELFLMDSDTT